LTPIRYEQGHKKIKNDQKAQVLRYPSYQSYPQSALALAPGPVRVLKTRPKLARMPFLAKYGFSLVYIRGDWHGRFSGFRKIFCTTKRKKSENLKSEDFKFEISNLRISNLR
jgi:hypothetical protein